MSSQLKTKKHTGGPALRASRNNKQQISILKAYQYKASQIKNMEEPHIKCFEKQKVQSQECTNSIDKSQI